MAPITILARFGSFLFKLGPKFCYSWARSGVWSTTSDLSGNNRLYRNFLTVGLMRALTPANSSSVESRVSRCVCKSRMPRFIGPHDFVLRFRICKRLEMNGAHCPGTSLYGEFGFKHASNKWK